MTTSMHDLRGALKAAIRRYRRTRTASALRTARDRALKLQLRTCRDDPRNRASLWCACCDICDNRACVDCFAGIMEASQ